MWFHFYPLFFFFIFLLSFLFLNFYFFLVLLVFFLFFLFLHFLFFISLFLGGVTFTLFLFYFFIFLRTKSYFFGKPKSTQGVNNVKPKNSGKPWVMAKSQKYGQRPGSSQRGSDTKWAKYLFTHTNNITRKLGKWDKP